jgi:hypothetical protein
LASYPPNSALFRWLHDLIDAWNANDNRYTFWFRTAGLPHRNYTIRVSHHGQSRVFQLARNAIRCHRNNQAVDIKQMEMDLAEVIGLMKKHSHFSRFYINEALPFMEFFIDLLETIEIYGLELTSAGEQALAFLTCAREDKECRKGNLLLIEDLLGILDRLVDGGFIEEDEAPTTDIGIHTSGWFNFFPTIKPFSLTLNLDAFVQPARSKEDRDKTKNHISDQELGCQRVDPSDYTGQSPSPK